ncbi:hypothetical protein PRIPAC_89244 [Pristionchus pacificus]|nr:hypothetical protein PRIPAC_89244 [Pristionchus pacificus]
MSLLLSVFCLAHSLNLRLNETDRSPPLAHPSSSSFTSYHLIIVYITCAFLATLIEAAFFVFPERRIERREERVAEGENEEERRIETEILPKMRRIKGKLDEMYISLQQINSSVDSVEELDNIINNYSNYLDAASLNLERLSEAMDKKAEYVSQILEIDAELRFFSNNDRIGPQVKQRVIEHRRLLQAIYLRTSQFSGRLIYKNSSNIRKLAAVIDEYKRSQESA